MKRKNGFTLIELLAVIIILAVIALIAVPQVIKILNSARLSAAEDSTYGIAKAAESYIANFMLKNDGSIPRNDLEFTCSEEGCELTSTLTGYDLTNLEKIDFKGIKPSTGTVKISDRGKTVTATNLKINGFICSYENEKATCIGTGNKNETTTTTTTTVACANKDDNGNCITTTTYQVGDAITLADYNWHIIGDDGTNVTLLMDAGQIEDMAHCGSANDSTNNCTFNGTYYVYSWDKSLIRIYLKDTLYPKILSKITNQIIPVEICADPSRGDGGVTYGGYLVSELNGASCTTTVSDYVRLINQNEYTTLKSGVSDTTWLYSSDIGYWWTMSASASSNTTATFVKCARNVFPSGDLSNSYGQNSSGIRPVITIQK